MALDEALWRSLPQIGQPTLRIYRWKVPTLSIGYSQSVAEFDLEECSRRGIALVRRPTGGRAVLHGLEVTYSLVHPLEGMGSIDDSHRQIGEALAIGLRKLGLAVELEMKGGCASSPACFEAPSHFELAIAGKKVAGSAQVRNQLALLEHGSIPLELDRERLAAVLRPDGLPQAGFERVLRGRAGGLCDFKEELRPEEVEVAIIAGFEERFGIELVEGAPTVEELQRAEKLMAQKYRDPGWNLRR